MRSGHLVVAFGLGVLGAAAVLRGDAAATLRADASQIDADIQQLQTDQQKLMPIEPDRKAVADAQKQLQTDSDPFQTQLTAAEQKCQDMLKAGHDAIKVARDQGHAAMQAKEQKLNQDRLRSKSDKSAAALVAQEEADLKAARQKLADDLKSMEDKLKAGGKSADDDLAKQRQAMDLALKPDRDALQKAQQQLNLDLLWQTKVDADRATLQADRQKLDADKQAAGQ